MEFVAVIVIAAVVFGHHGFDLGDEGFRGAVDAAEGGKIGTGLRQGHGFGGLQNFIQPVSDPFADQKFTFHVAPVAHGVYQSTVHIKNGVVFVHGENHPLP
jgi:hypothetical protein